MLSRLLEPTVTAAPRVRSETWLPVDRSGAVASHAGMAVSEEQSLTLPAVFCAVDLMATHLAMLPCPVIHRIDRVTTQREPDHPVHRLVNRDPNPEMGSFALRRSQHLHAMLWGNGRLEIERDLGGKPHNLWLLFPDRTRTIRLDRSNELAYRVTRDDGRQEGLSADDVVHVAGLSYDGIEGYGLIRHLARENIGQALAIARFAQSFFGNNTILGAVLTTPETLAQETKDSIRAAWNAANQGSSKAFKAVVLDGGLDVKHLGQTNKDSQTVEQMTFAIQDVSRWTGVPPPLLMDLSRGTFTNIRELGQWYVKYYLASWFKPIEQELTRKLFSQAELDDGYYVEFVAEGLLRGDLNARIDGYVKGLLNGIYTLDEVRAWENLNPVPDGAGQVHRIQMQMTPVGAESDEPEPEPPSQGSTPDDEASDMRQQIAEAHEPLIASVFDRMDRVEDKAVQRAQKTSTDFAAWSARFYPEHMTKLRDAMIPVMDALAGAVRATLPATVLDAEWSRFVGSFTKALCEGHIELRKCGSSIAEGRPARGFVNAATSPDRGLVKGPEQELCCG